MLLKYREVAFFILMMSLTACRVQSPPTYPGYSYGEFIYLSYSANERIDQLWVKKGDKVRKGQTLLTMEAFTTRNTLEISEKEYLAEKARLTDLISGERPAELAVIRAQLESALSEEELAKKQSARLQKLYRTGVISADEWQKSAAGYRQKSARVEELKSRLDVGKLPARDALIESQQLQVESARLQRDKARWELQQSTLIAPQDALVFDTLYRPGERVIAGRPLISLLSPENVRVRFFIPEKELGALHTGMKVQLVCDGCKQSYAGRINYISPEAEYSPPVIYSTERREKLVYMAEAVPEKSAAALINIGQPYRVEIIPDE